MPLGFPLSSKGVRGLDSRRFARYQVTAKAFFSWKEQRSRRTGEGTTRDISAAGMFVSTVVRPAAATRVRVEVVLPPLQEGLSPVRVKVLGRVVRVETDRSEAPGFALTSQNFVLRNGASAKSIDPAADGDLGSGTWFCPAEKSS